MSAAQYPYRVLKIDSTLVYTNDIWPEDVGLTDKVLQRWYGTKKTREVRKALKNCNFDQEIINALIKKSE